MAFPTNDDFHKYFLFLLNQASQKAYVSNEDLTNILGIDYSTLTRYYGTFNSNNPNVFTFCRLLNYLDLMKMTNEECEKKIRFYINEFYEKFQKNKNQMARYLKVSVSNVSRWINGQSFPNSYYFKKIIEGLDVLKDEKQDTIIKVYHCKANMIDFISLAPKNNIKLSFSEYFELLKFLEENFPSKN